MTRQIERLTTGAVTRATRRGLHPDGAGLYLQVGRTGGRSWIYRYTLRGRTRYMGLGSAALVSLREARRKVLGCRRIAADGQDPLEVRRQQSPKRPKVPTFKAAAETYVKANESGWRNARQAAQWRSSLAAYAYPAFGSLPVDAVDTARVLKALQPIWFSKAETATRVRARIQSVLDWASARGFRQGENPARWEGHLDKLLPRRSKVAKVEHHPALPFDQLPAFMVDLRSRSATAARALEFAVLTAARTGEALGARWSEVDLHRKTWTIPADRMKAGREHRVPLPDRAVALIQSMQTLSRGDVIFPAADGLRPLSNMALLMMLRRMQRQDLTVHGFRSTFRDWVAERTDFPGEVAEMALAHTVRNQVEAAYRRGDLFEKRRQLMEAWSAFAAGVAAKPPPDQPKEDP
jgi:integrase